MPVIWKYAKSGSMRPRSGNAPDTEAAVQYLKQRLGLNDAQVVALKRMRSVSLLGNELADYCEITRPSHTWDETDLRRFKICSWLVSR